MGSVCQHCDLDAFVACQSNSRMSFGRICLAYHKSFKCSNHHCIFCNARLCLLDCREFVQTNTENVRTHWWPHNGWHNGWHYGWHCSAIRMLQSATQYERVQVPALYQVWSLHELITSFDDEHNYVRSFTSLANKSASALIKFEKKLSNSIKNSSLPDRIRLIEREKWLSSKLRRCLIWRIYLKSYPLSYQALFGWH